MCGLILPCQNHTLFQTKRAKSITLFQTKTAPKPYPLNLPPFPRGYISKGGGGLKQFKLSFGTLYVGTLVMFVRSLQ